MITMKEVQYSTVTKNMFFSNYVQEIKSEHVVIDANSFVYLNSASRKDLTNVHYQRKWDYENCNHLKEFVFDCSILFHYPVKESSPTIQPMLSMTRRVLDLDTYASLHEDEDFADFTLFKVRDKEFKVHKCLMAAASSVCKTMFTCGLDESKYNSATIDCNPEVFEHFLAYIYKNVSPFDKMPSLYDLCQAIRMSALLWYQIIDEDLFGIYQRSKD